MSENRQLAYRIVEAVIWDLDGRSGFDHWWGGLGEEVRAKIHEELVQNAANILEESSK